MTLDMWGWLLTFVILGGFLVTTAYIWEKAQPESSDRNQAHPLHGSGVPSSTGPGAPVSGLAGMDGTPDLRERVGQSGD